MSLSKGPGEPFDKLRANGFVLVAIAQNHDKQNAVRPARFPFGLSLSKPAALSLSKPAALSLSKPAALSLSKPRALSLSKGPGEPFDKLRANGFVLVAIAQNHGKQNAVRPAPFPFGLSLSKPAALSLSKPPALSLSKPPALSLSKVPGEPFDKLRANGFVLVAISQTHDKQNAVRTTHFPFTLSLPQFRKPTVSKMPFAQPIFRSG